MLIAKLCVNIAFFGCCTQFSHTAASLNAKWLHTDWASLGSLVAATSLDTRSTCKLCFTSAMAIHSSPACTASPVKEGWNLDHKHVSYHKFWSVMQHFFPIKSDPLQLVAPFLWMKFALFRRTIKINLNWILMNPYLEVEGLVSVSIWPEIAYNYLTKMISDHFWSVGRGHDPGSIQGGRNSWDIL